MGSMGRVENRLSPALHHQTVHAVFPHTAFRCSSHLGMRRFPARYCWNFMPMAWHCFGSWKRSPFRDMHAYGEEGVRFYTNQYWQGGRVCDASSKVRAITAGIFHQSFWPQQHFAALNNLAEMLLKKRRFVWCIHLQL